MISAIQEEQANGKQKKLLSRSGYFKRSRCDFQRLRSVDWACYPSILVKISCMLYEVHISSCPENWFEVKSKSGVKSINHNRNLNFSFWTCSLEQEELSQNPNPSYLLIPCLSLQDSCPLSFCEGEGDPTGRGGKPLAQHSSLCLCLSF